MKTRAIAISFSIIFSLLMSSLTNPGSFIVKMIANKNVNVGIKALIAALTNGAFAMEMAIPIVNNPIRSINDLKARADLSLIVILLKVSLKPFQKKIKSIIEAKKTPILVHI